MKSIKNIAMIATAAVAMMAASTTNSFAANASAPEPAPSIINEVMHTPHVMQYYRNNSNHQTRRFEYTVDAMGRVTDKVMYGWNKATSTWTPMCQYHVDFGTDSHELTFSSWNEKTQSFSSHITTMHYKANEYPEVITLPQGAF